MMKRIFLILFLCSMSQISAKPPIPTPPGTPILGEVDAYLLKTMFKDTDPEANLSSLVKRKDFQELVKKNKLLLFGGPMLGCITDKSAKIWVRTPGPAKVQAILSSVKSKAVTTSAVNDFTAILEINGLKPYSEYSYDILVDGKSVLKTKPRFRTYPSKGQNVDFEVVFGGGARYNPPKERIWTTIAKRRPLACLLLGDNVYIDIPSKRNAQRVFYYRRQLREEYRQLTSSTGIYGIYDDHDLGKNDCSGGPDRFKPSWKFESWKVFRENWVNPYYGGGDRLPGCWFDFSIGDVHFIMTDNRYYRDFKKTKTMLGPKQKDWLIRTLKKSQGTFKVIASGTLWTENADKGGKDSWWGVKDEREEIFSVIDKAKIGGVILISADRHRTDIHRIRRPNGYDLYEFETSKLTNNHTHRTNKKALFSYNKGNFFGAMEFNFKKTDPEMTFRCIGIDGKLIHSMTLKRSRLQKR